MRKPKLS